MFYDDNHDVDSGCYFVNVLFLLFCVSMMDKFFCPFNFNGPIFQVRWNFETAPRHSELAVIPYEVVLCCTLFIIGGRRFSEGTSADREIQRTLMEVIGLL